MTKGVAMVCHCGTPYLAKATDLKRGWALSCSKSCAAMRRVYGDSMVFEIDQSLVLRAIKMSSALRASEAIMLDALMDVFTLLREDIEIEGM